MSNKFLWKRIEKESDIQVGSIIRETGEYSDITREPEELEITKIKIISDMAVFYFWSPRFQKEQWVTFWSMKGTARSKSFIEETNKLGFKRCWWEVKQ